ncbi:hypothetical protein GCM10010359_37350 [Streptomyces morookaense]|nr:hypothetical protein GCM10010359_37350 [Streptomyces morookaense]
MQERYELAAVEGDSMDAGHAFAPLPHGIEPGTLCAGRRAAREWRRGGPPDAAAASRPSAPGLRRRCEDCA